MFLRDVGGRVKRKTEQESGAFTEYKEINTKTGRKLKTQKGTK